MKNMSVEDILDELGGYGSVTLRRVKFPVNASHLNGLGGKYPAEKWKLELRLPGYDDGSLNAYVEAVGSSIRAVAETVYSALEEYVHSPRAAEDRKRYEDRHALDQKRYDQATSHEQTSGHNPIRPPERFKPPIVWGQPRSW